MVNQITLKSFNYASHLVILVHLMLGLFGLVLELSSQTSILNYCQFGGAHQLIFIHIKHFHFNSSYL